MLINCKICDHKLNFISSTTNLVTRYCSICCQFWLQHNLKEDPNKSWQEQNISSDFLNSLKKRRLIQSQKILKRWKHQIQEPVLDYACGQGTFTENAAENHIKIKGADLNRVGPNAQDIIQIKEPWDSLICATFKTVTLLDVIEHHQNPTDFLAKLNSHNVECLIIKVPNSNGPSSIIARILMRFNQPKLWEILNLVGDYSPHQVFFSTHGLKLMLNKAGYTVIDKIQLTEFGSELPKRLRFQVPLLKFPIQIFGILISLISPLWCDNITILATKNRQ